MSNSVLVVIDQARTGELSIELRLDHTRLTPSEAFDLARALMAGADFAIGLDGTAPEGAPVDEEPF